MNIVLKSSLIIIFIILLMKSNKKSKHVVKKEKFSVQSICNKQYKISDLLVAPGFIEEIFKAYGVFLFDRDVNEWPDGFKLLKAALKLWGFDFPLPNDEGIDELKKWLVNNNHSGKKTLKEISKLISTFLNENEYKKFDTDLNKQWNDSLVQTCKDIKKKEEKNKTPTTPVKPTPVEPTPVKPTPVKPTPEPTPEPTSENPTHHIPTPQNPTPIIPTKADLDCGQFEDVFSYSDNGNVQYYCDCEEGYALNELGNCVSCLESDDKKNILGYCCNSDESLDEYNNCVSCRSSEGKKEINGICCNSGETLDENYYCVPST